MDLNDIPVSLFDSLVALSFIISSVIGLLLYSLTYRKQPIRSEKELQRTGLTVPVVNGLTGHPIPYGEAFLLRNGISIQKQVVPKSGHVKVPYPSVLFDEILFTSPGFRSDRRKVEELPKKIELTPHLPHLSRRLTRIVLRLLRGIEIVLLLLGTVLIPATSSSVWIIFLLASISLWLLQLRRLSRPRLQLQIVNTKTGHGVSYATVIFHKPDQMQEVITDRSGFVWADLPLPSSISVACHNYHSIPYEVLPATAIAHDGIYIPMHPR